MNSAAHHSLRILVLGALLGTVLGTLDATDWLTPNQKLSESSIAAVNSTQIRLLEYQRALNMLASEKRDPITDQDRNLVLQRLIDEGYRQICCWRIWRVQLEEGNRWAVLILHHTKL